MKNVHSDLEALWDSAPASTRVFDPRQVADRPALVQRYLLRAIAPGTLLASAVRLRMHGAIKVKRWRPFRAEQVIVAGRGSIWRARVKVGGTAIRGFDRFVDGEGAMRWKLCGTFPVARASGADVSRSAAGRFAAESVWLPSLLCDDRVAWRVDAAGLAHAQLPIGDTAMDIALALSQGSVQSVALSRWGNPEGGAFREVAFGAHVDQEATFDGYTIPVRLRVGWHFGTERFEGEGLFFRVTIDDAVYR
ncbi:MAG: DUF6920 family protein [Rudaea sp.]